MITLKELEKMHEEYKNIALANGELYEEQKNALIKLMEEYQEVAKWYFSNGFINVDGYYQEIGNTLFLSEDETYIYYWNPERVGVSRFDKTQHKDRGTYNSLIFVRKGHFESAKKNIKQLNSTFKYVLESLKNENEQLKNSLKGN